MPVGQSSARATSITIEIGVEAATAVAFELGSRLEPAGGGGAEQAPPPGPGLRSAYRLACALGRGLHDRERRVGVVRSLDRDVRE